MAANRDQLLREGERLLAEWGAADAAPAALTAWIGRAPAADLAIAHRLGGLASDDSLRALEQLGQSADKLVRKEVKRSRYRLEQRGVAVPEPPAAPAPAPVLVPDLEGYVSPIDGRGDQLVWLVKPRPGGLAHLFAMINDPDGLREVDLNVITRKALKALRAELAEKHEMHFVEIDWRYADFLIHRAFGWARARNTPMNGDYPALRTQLLKEPAPDDLPPRVLARLDAAVVRADPGLLAASAELLHEKEFRTWFLGPDDARPYLEEMAQIKESPLVLNKLQQHDRFDAVIDHAVGDRFGGALRESYVRRLYAMAYIFAATKRDVRARQAVAVALALADPATNARTIPFCEQLVGGSLAAWVEAAAAEEAERAKGSLVVTPQQFAAERQQR
jgi:hypothetical protein